MSLSAERLNRAQKQAKEYMEKHMIEKLISDMLNSLIHAKDDSPLIYMVCFLPQLSKKIKYISSLCPEEELVSKGITITGPLPRRQPILRFPQFNETCNSLLKKYLTEQVWKELRNVRTRFDGRLTNCILAGVENPALRIGVYACDGDAYHQFRKLFEPILKELHDFDFNNSIPIQHNLDTLSIDWSKIERTKHCIKFVQATGSRNLEGYPFIPILDSHTKGEIECKLRAIINEDLDYKVMLNKLDIGEKKRITEEGLMFDRHPSLETIVPGTKWGEGCAIYYSHDLSHMVWINGDDHLQFVLTHKGKADLQQVCEKLFGRLRTVEAQVPVWHDPSLGYLTCNPAFIGSALRIKVVVQLQKASDNMIKLELIKAFCTLRGIDVKHAALNTYEFTLNRTFQMGRTEVDMVTGLVDSLAELLKVEDAMIAMEEELMQKKFKEETEKLMREMPRFDETNQSLVKSFINEALWLRLGRLHTTFGHTLPQCISPALTNDHVGLIAFDADCYNKYDEIIFSVVRKLHPDYTPVNFSLITGDPHVFSETLRKYEGLQSLVGGYLLWQGNMKDCSFPPGLTKKQREDCIMKLFLAIDAFNKEHLLNLFGIEDLPEVKSSLFYSDLLAQRSASSEFLNDWPDQRRALKSQMSKLVLLTNIINHVALVCTLDPRTVPNDVMLFLTAFVSLVMKIQNLWAFSDRWGFMNSLLTDIGSGFTIKVAVKLDPGLALQTYEQLAASKKVEMVQVGDLVYLTHKSRFSSLNQCITDTLDIAHALTYQLDPMRMDEPIITMPGEVALPGVPVEEEANVDNNAVQEVPVAEPAAEQQEAADAPAAENEAAPEKEEVAFQENYRGVFKEVLTQELYQELKPTVSPKGMTISHLFAAALANPNDYVGLFNESAETFTTFKDLYIAVANKLAEGVFDTISSENIPSTDLLPSLEFPAIPSGVKGEYLALSRNLEGISFPPFMQDSDRENVAKTLASLFETLEVFCDMLSRAQGENHGKWYELDDAQLSDRLQESSMGLGKYIKISPNKDDGIYYNWPKGRAVFILDDNEYFYPNKHLIGLLYQLTDETT
eukprot:TRINITY_DN193_c0_g1_i1.p1 TRINITY_DN193_c0_g1~~TRINITY_DN193_c0_g1_i1.p1  ORF type:complete len:1068 (+),score=100.36 TRINITY_DN193_c0_g1_i1:8004-11207(+)